jgi:hypothetical protein
MLHGNTLHSYFIMLFSSLNVPAGALMRLSIPDLVAAQ